MPPRKLVGALCATLLPVCALAQPAEQDAPSAALPREAPLGELAPAWFELTVNEVPRGQVLVRLGGGDVWIDADDLQRGGVTVEGGERIAAGGRSLVSLRSLGPRIAFVLDEENTLLRVSASQAALGRSSVDLNPRKRPPGLRSGSVPSAFLNLGARADDWSTFTSSAELGTSIGPAVLLSNASWSSDGGFLRGLTVAHVDDPASRVRYSAGELFASSSDPLGGSALVLGLSAGREFSLDPYALRDPYPRTSIFVETPSTLEVWVGDTLVRRSRVAPGTLDIENLPLEAGANEVRTVLRDAFGREQSASSRFLMGSNLLSPGVVDWRLQAGFERRSGLDGAIAYGPPIALGAWRAGLTRLVTLGARAEASPDVVSGGLLAGLATALGDVEGGIAASRAGEAGGAGFLGVRARPARWASVVAQARLVSDHYASMSLLPRDDRSVARALLGASVSPGPGFSILGELSAYRQRDAGTGASATVRGSWTVARGQQLALSTSVSGQAGRERAWEISLSWAMLLPGGHSVEAATRTGTVGEAAWLTATRNLGAEPGVGYRVQGRVGDGGLAAVDLRGQSAFGTAAFMERWADPLGAAGGNQESLEAATGLVLIDGELHASRPIDGSYALLILEDAPGVRAFLGGQPVGRTDSGGRIFIPGLVPYYGNRVTIRDADLPMDFKVNEVERYVAPRFRGGTVERFDVGPTLVVSGKVVLAIDEKGTVQDLAPGWGEIAVELPTGRVVSPIAADGSFWLEGMQPGRQEALVRWEGRLCRFTLDVGRTRGTVDVGLQRCVQMLASGDASVPPPQD